MASQRLVCEVWVVLTLFWAPLCGSAAAQINLQYNGQYSGQYSGQYNGQTGGTGSQQPAVQLGNRRYGPSIGPGEWRDDSPGFGQSGFGQPGFGQYVGLGIGVGLGAGVGAGRLNNEVPGETPSTTIPNSLPTQTPASQKDCQPGEINRDPGQAVVGTVRRRCGY
jgi:hypothetical protein